MAQNKIPAASDLSFHQKIMDKYRKAKKKFSNFPIMIFMKNMGHLLNDKNNMGFFFRLSLNVRSMFASIRQEKKIFRNFVNSHNNILMRYNTSQKNPIVNNEINPLLNIANFIWGAHAFNSFQKVMFDNLNFSGFSRHILDNRGFSFDNNKYYSFVNKGISQTISLRIKGKEAGNNSCVISSQKNPTWMHNTFSRPDWQQLNYNSIFKSIDVRVQKNVLINHHSFFNTKPDEISTCNLFQTNNTLKNDFQGNIYGHSVFWGSQKQDFSNHIRVSKMYEIKYPAIYLRNNSLLNNRTLLYGEGNSFKEIKQSNIFKDQYNFFFKNNHKMEQKIEQVKKIADELKNAVAQKSIPGKENKNEIDLHIDINRISDRVYQMIDQKIKIEKERRGYL